MNALQSPSLSAPRTRYMIQHDIFTRAARMYALGDIAEGDRLRDLYYRVGDQIRLTRIANRYPRR